MDSLALLFRKKKKKQGCDHHSRARRGPKFLPPNGGRGRGGHPSQQFDIICDLDTLPPPPGPLGHVKKFCATMIQIWTRAKPYLLFLEICRILKSKQRGCRDKKVETPEKRSRRDLVASAQKTSNLPARPLKKKMKNQKIQQGLVWFSVEVKKIINPG